MKKKYYIIGYTLGTSIFILFQLFKYDLYLLAKAKSFGYEIILGFLEYFIYIIYILVIISAIYYLISKAKLKKWKASIPVVLCFIIFILNILPATDHYASWNYIVNRSRRTEIVNMVKGGLMTDQIISMHEYKVPWRSLSYSKTIAVQNTDDGIKIMFYTYIGLNLMKAIVYVSDDSGVDESDFNFSITPTYNLHYENQKKLDENWYLVTIKD